MVVSNNCPAQIIEELRHQWFAWLMEPTFVKNHMMAWLEDAWLYINVVYVGIGASVSIKKFQ